MGRTCTLLVGLTLAVLAGCPPQGELDSSPAELGPLVTTSIPPGIYMGELSMTTKTEITGQAPTEKTEKQPYHEVVNESGLPLLEPGGIVPRAGVVIPLELGGVIETYTIESVETFGDRLVITYTTSMTVQGVTLSGFGSWVYEFTAPSTLGFTEQAIAASGAVNGRIMTYADTASATLTK